MQQTLLKYTIKAPPPGPEPIIREKSEAYHRKSGFIFVQARGVSTVTSKSHLKYVQQIIKSPADSVAFLDYSLGKIDRYYNLDILDGSFECAGA